MEAILDDFFFALVANYDTVVGHLQPVPNEASFSSSLSQVSNNPKKGQSLLNPQKFKSPINILSQLIGWPFVFRQERLLSKIF